MNRLKNARMHAKAKLLVKKSIQDMKKLGKPSHTKKVKVRNKKKKATVQTRLGIGQKKNAKGKKY